MKTHGRQQGAEIGPRKQKEMNVNSASISVNKGWGLKDKMEPAKQRLQEKSSQAEGLNTLTWTALYICGSAPSTFL